MGRANRLRGDGGVFHLTHRCHNRAFLLKFTRDRQAYRELLRKHLQKFNLSLLDYCVTSNHVHLLVDSQERLEIGRFMQEVASEFARGYNSRKKRIHAFWGDNYHATLVEPGRHLWECLCYIELNMVRCRAVTHPSQWPWVGYHEIMGLRRRYRMIDLEQLCWRLETSDLDAVRNNLETSLAARIARGALVREPIWTESLAVGSVGFLEKIAPEIESRIRTEIVETPDGAWMLREESSAYMAKTGPKNDPKTSF